MPAQTTTATLTDRELAVLRGVVRGEKYRIIGRRLGVCKETVKGDTAAIRQKLGVETLTQAVAVAVADGMIEAR